MSSAISVTSVHVLDLISTLARLPMDPEGTSLCKYCNSLKNESTENRRNLQNLKTSEFVELILFIKPVSTLLSGRQVSMIL